MLHHCCWASPVPRWSNLHSETSCRVVTPHTKQYKNPPDLIASKVYCNLSLLHLHRCISTLQRDHCFHMKARFTLVCRGSEFQDGCDCYLTSLKNFAHLLFCIIELPGGQLKNSKKSVALREGRIVGKEFSCIEVLRPSWDFLPIFILILVLLYTEKEWGQT